MARGGEVFVLDMGQPVRIVDLAQHMIELAGLRPRDAQRPGGDVEIVEIGLRPGEKLYEELLIGDAPEPTAHPRIFKAAEALLPIDLLRPKLEGIRRLLTVDARGELIAALRDLVPEFHNTEGVVDWTHLERLEAAALSKIA